MERANSLISFVCLCCAIMIAIHTSMRTNAAIQQNIPVLKKTDKATIKEAGIIKRYCEGFQNYKLPDGTKVDCVTDKYTIEYELANQWHKGIGKAMYAAKLTNKQPALMLILDNEKDNTYTKKVKTTNPDITVFTIRNSSFE